MHKKETSLHHSKIANNMMNYINEHIDTDINIDQLSFDFGISKFHLHRIFKEQMGTNIYETIKSIRLQKASNLLITNKHSTITEVANMCGYSSQTSFLRAFKQRFEQTPKVWRNGGYKDYSNKILSASQTASLSEADFSHLAPKIIKTKKKTLYYIRQKGYDKKAMQTWQKMMAWVYTNDIKEHEQIGIYHDNPIITPLQDCYYVAGIAPKNSKNLENTNLPSFDIHENIICATFEVEGKYGDILKLIQWVYHHWLPNSGFETTTIPSYTIFTKNHFLSDDGLFKCTYYVPVRYV
ncbi:MAG: AraC family transcriptional regulator [Campylobacterota bacterium]|nr:AraC family transcriptional regulator [Campylobacterota bacterium]